MRIFLCGGGSGEKTILANIRFNEVIEHTKPILYIPLAMDVERYSDCYKWLSEELKSVDICGIEMVSSAEEIISKNLADYAAIFIGGGNTFKLLNELKLSGAFEKIRAFIAQNGIVFGGSAGAIIFGEDIDTAAFDDENDVGLMDTAGFDILNGISLFCHYTNKSEEENKESTDYLLEQSLKKNVLALPEEDTIFVDGKSVEVIGTKPYYYFKNGVMEKYEINEKIEVML